MTKVEGQYDEAVRALLAKLRCTGQKHRASGVQRSPEDMLAGAFDTLTSFVEFLHAVGGRETAPLAYLMAEFTAHLEPSYPRRSHLFTPKAALVAKTAPNGWMTHVKRAMLTALCQVLHEDGLTVADACKCVAGVLESAGLHFEDGRARGRNQGGDRTTARLKEWRKDANGGKFKGEFPALYERAVDECRKALVLFKTSETPTFARELLIQNTVAKVCEQSCSID